MKSQLVLRDKMYVAADTPQCVSVCWYGKWFTYTIAQCFSEEAYVN
jgi:coproporphyrinogen III oxidase-like Fe-S oxidoreductase